MVVNQNTIEHWWCLHAMRHANFCLECGERIARKGWSAPLRRPFCSLCAKRVGGTVVFRPVIILLVVSLAAFSFGRYLRPAPPPLLIQRSANSPLPDTPINYSVAERSAVKPAEDKNVRPVTSVAGEEGYICGARTRKGTPCQRRVHAPGERCFQHKGLPAMVPPEKLIIKPK
jgi:hypothetical protein